MTLLSRRSGAAVVGAAALALALTACAGSSAPRSRHAHDPVATIGLNGANVELRPHHHLGGRHPQV